MRCSCFCLRQRYGTGTDTVCTPGQYLIPERAIRAKEWSAQQRQHGQHELWKETPQIDGSEGGLNRPNDRTYLPFGSFTHIIYLHLYISYYLITRGNTCRFVAKKSEPCQLGWASHDFIFSPKNMFWLESEISSNNNCYLSEPGTLQTPSTHMPLLTHYCLSN